MPEMAVGFAWDGAANAPGSEFGIAMAQARSEATRQKIIDAAIDVIDDVGYPAANLIDIIARAELTKGALYYHFGSKDQLAAAILEEDRQRLMMDLAAIVRPSVPALENMINALLALADLVSHDKRFRVGAHLARALGQYSEVATKQYVGWLEGVRQLAIAAQEEGDLRGDLNAADVGEAIYAAMNGAEVVSNAASGGTDLVARIIRIWEVLLPAFVTEEALPYFRTFLARAATQYVQKVQAAE
jgi:AcrR family transcriptional regulator